MQQLRIPRHQVFDRIVKVKANAMLSVVATDRIYPWPDYRLRYCMPLSNERLMSRYLEEMKDAGQVIDVSRSKRIWAPEPLYGPPMVVAVQDSQSECDFRVLTQGETLAAHRIGGFQYICVNVVSGDEDSLFLAAVYDNTENGHRYRYHEITRLIREIKERFPCISEWEIARLVGAEPALVEKVLGNMKNR